MPAAMQVEPYLFFDGRCEEALQFYRGALGAEVPGTDAVDQDLLFPALRHVADRFGVSWMIYVAPAGEARSEALARRFEAKAQEALATLEGLGHADWKKVTAAEKWSVGVTAHHVAGVLMPISYIIKAVAAGEPLEGFGPTGSTR